MVIQRSPLLRRRPRLVFFRRCAPAESEVMFDWAFSVLLTETEFFGLGDDIGSAGYFVSFVLGTLFRGRIASPSSRQSLQKSHADYRRYYHPKFFEFQSPEQVMCREENGTFCISGYVHLHKNGARNAFD